MAALAHEMPAEQYRAWLAYSEIEPFGDIQADLRAGAIARVVAEPNRDRAAHPAPFTALDFVPWVMTEERLAEREAQREAGRGGGSEDDLHEYLSGEEWPEATPAQIAAAERRALILAGIEPDEIDSIHESPSESN